MKRVVRDISLVGLCVTVPLGAHQPHWGKLSADILYLKISSPAICIYDEVKKVKTLGEKKTIFFSHKCLIDIFWLPLQKCNEMAHCILYVQVYWGKWDGKKCDRPFCWIALKKNKTAKLQCCKYRHTGMGTPHRLCMQHEYETINMRERQAELSNQAARLSLETFWLPREKRILFRRSPINGQYALLPPLPL